MFQTPEYILKNSFWLEEFRDGQREIIECVIAGKNTLVLMPTWGGKSLTYQIPALCRPWVAIVISPLISLMKDQADKLNSLGIRTEVINSMKSAGEIADILEDLRWNDESASPIRFIYIAPERLRSRAFIASLSDVPISLLAIDEAHCISQWWHDFRTSYLQVHDFIKLLRLDEKGIPVMALTATATQKVRTDIIERLGLKKYETFIKGFDRPNIAIVVREISKKDAKFAKMLEIINKTPGVGIVYCSTLNHVEEVNEFFSRNGIASGKYTGSVTGSERENIQNAFMNDGLKVMVATNAFGMGIDKKDIRFIIHYNLPGSIESYYQEAGRAGRDGKNSYSIILASYQDTKIQEFFIENAHPPKADILAFYDYLYDGLGIGEWKGKTIQKTQSVMAKESKMKSDMQVGSIIRLFEKFAILERGTDGSADEGFRGRGLTLTAVRRPASNIGVDWDRQKLLQDESYHKLDAVKKLLFSPHCRKKHILEYFGDQIDAAKMKDGCGSCDFCLGSSGSGQPTESIVVPLSSFELILETVKTYDDKFGLGTIKECLAGSDTKNIRKYSMDDAENYGILKQYPIDAIDAMLKNLEQEWYVERSSGMYPKVKLTAKGKKALYNEDILKEDIESLTNIDVEIVPQKTTKGKKWTTAKSGAKSAGGKYSETLALFESWEDIKSIALQQDLTVQTIQNHIILLYEQNQIALASLTDIIELDRIKRFKALKEKAFPTELPFLKVMKETFEREEKTDISYFEIKMGLAMIEKREV